MNFLNRNNKKASDEALINQFRKKNDLAILGMLYDRYMHLVYGVCLKYLKNREESQDAVMQIFEVLIKEIPKHDIRVFKSWLYGVSRNFCLMKLRREATKKNQLSSISADFFMENLQEMHPIDTDDCNLEGKLQTCLEKLKIEQQNCIQLFYYNNKSYREIATELQFEENKVKSFIQNGKRNLKICIEQKEKTHHD